MDLRIWNNRYPDKRLRFGDYLTFESQALNSRIWIRCMNRPPPYFPQSQLSPPDEKRYRNFKISVGVIIFFLTLLAVTIGIGIYYLVVWMMA